MKSAVGFFLLAGSLMSAPGDVPEQSLRTAIEAFLSNPLASSSKDHAKTILSFAIESEAVEVIVNETACPWLASEPESEHSEVLLGAFIAGNIRSQLDTGVAKNDAYSGVIQVIRVYRHLKAKNPKLSISAVEKLLEAHKRGKLWQHLDETPDQAE